MEEDLDTIRQRILDEAQEYAETFSERPLSKATQIRLSRIYNDIAFSNKGKELKLKKLKDLYNSQLCKQSHPCKLKSRSLSEVRVEFITKPPSMGNQKGLLYSLSVKIDYFENLIKKESEESSRLTYIQNRERSIVNELLAKVSDIKTYTEKYENLRGVVRKSKSEACFHLIRDQDRLKTASRGVVINRDNRKSYTESLRKKEKAQKDQITRMATKVAKSSQNFRSTINSNKRILEALNDAVLRHQKLKGILTEQYKLIDEFNGDFQRIQKITEKYPLKGPIVDKVVGIWGTFKSEESKLQEKFEDLCQLHYKLSNELDTIRLEVRNTNNIAKIIEQISHLKGKTGGKLTTNLIADAKLKTNIDRKTLEEKELLILKVLNFFQRLLEKIMNEMRLIKLYSFEHSEEIKNALSKIDSSKAGLEPIKRYSTIEAKQFQGFFKYKKNKTNYIQNPSTKADKRINCIKGLTDTMVLSSIYGIDFSEFVLTNRFLMNFIKKSILRKVANKYKSIREDNFLNAIQDLFVRTNKKANNLIYAEIFKTEKLLTIVENSNKEGTTHENNGHVKELKMKKSHVFSFLKLVFGAKNKLISKQKRLKKEEITLPSRFITLSSNLDNQNEIKENNKNSHKENKMCFSPQLVVNNMKEDLNDFKRKLKSLSCSNSNLTSFRK